MKQRRKASSKTGQRGRNQPQKWKGSTQNEEVKSGPKWTLETHDGGPGTGRGGQRERLALLVTPKDVRGREKTAII